MDDHAADLKEPSPSAAGENGLSWSAAARRGLQRWFGAGIRVFVLLVAIGLVIVVARDWDWWVSLAVLQSTDDAYLKADTTPLAAKSAGYVRIVPVADFQKVKAGDLLVAIVDDDYRASLEQPRQTSRLPAR